MTLAAILLLHPGSACAAENGPPPVPMLREWEANLSRIPLAIKTGLDACWERAWVEADEAFWYRANARGQGVGTLNPLVAPAYAWYYLQTGEARYRDRGDRVFAGGVKGAWLQGGKQFSQSYRWSFRYVEWRREADSHVSPPSIGPGAAMKRQKPE